MGALTVFLGGMGSLGLARGIIPEAEAQLVLGCTLGFALLEVCSNRLRTYYNFMFGQMQKNLDQDPEDKANKTSVEEIQLAYYRGTHLIRLVILCLQLYLLVIYNNTIVHLDLKNYQHTFFIFFCSFWAVLHQWETEAPAGLQTRSAAGQDTRSGQGALARRHTDRPLRADLIKTTVMCEAWRRRTIAPSLDPCCTSFSDS